jgi:hypothetical protein
MLSILIPIYNQDVRTLVYTLSKQCVKAKINYQILCFDDGSEDKWKHKNAELSFKVNINYTELNENLGRSKIRNWLGRYAYYDHVLFLDGDSTVRNKDFIKNYIANLPQGDSIVYGGTKYSTKPPNNKRKYLHWYYGSKVEAQPASIRAKNPYHSFHSNNFCAPSAIFNDFKFDERIQGYGYEDTLYAFNLKNHRINIIHIDNPVIHDGLEINTVYLEKTAQATNNLAMLYAHQMIEDTRLIRTYQRLKKWKLLNPVLGWVTSKENKIKENLLSPKPSLRYLQMWKLLLFHHSISKF